MFLDLEARIDRGHLRLIGAEGEEHVAEPRLDEATLEALREHELAGAHAAYGRALFDAVFPVESNARRGLFSAFDHVLKEDRRLRLRLSLPQGDAALRALHWELMSDGHDLVLGRSPQVVLSRYVPRPYLLTPAPARPRLLCVVAAPIDAHRYRLAPIDYAHTADRLRAIFASLAGAIDIDILPRPVTAERLRDALQQGEHQLLHIHGHGALSRGGESALVLEDEDSKASFVRESALDATLLGLHGLKAVVLVACHGAANSAGGQPLSGLAGSLLTRDVPAVVAMRRPIGMDLGFDFARVFYQSLAKEPCIDAAVNEARHRLFMARPEGMDWSSPVLFMRLRDGLLWRPAAEDGGPKDSTPEDGAPGNALPETPRRLVVQMIVGLVVALALTAAIGQWLRPPDTLDPPAITSLPDDGTGNGAGPTSPEDGTSDNATPSGGTTIATPPPPAVRLEPIRTASIGVGVAESVDLAWSDAIARRALQWLRAERGDVLAPALLPAELRAKLQPLLEGDLSALPGGDRAPAGLEYIVVVVEDHGPYQATRLNNPTVSVSCNWVLIETRGPRTIRSDSAQHLGQDRTETGALEQAFGRCFESAFTDFP